MAEGDGYRKPAVAGTGAIAVGLASAMSAIGEVVVLARSDSSAERAQELADRVCGKLTEADVGRVSVTTEIAELGGCDVIVEAIVEDADAKVALHAALAEACPGADLATTTSSLSIAEIAEAAGTPKLFGFHVFNPVPRMKLVEVCIPDGAADSREKALAWCAALGKTAVEVPDEAGFVVNRLLFPYLFDAARMVERTGMEPGAVDTCMKLGAGHPMGPLALLDFVGMDVSKAIGDALYAETNEPTHNPPPIIVKMCEEGKLGRKSGAGFYSYD